MSELCTLNTKKLPKGLRNNHENRDTALISAGEGFGDKHLQGHDNHDN